MADSEGIQNKPLMLSKPSNCVSPLGSNSGMGTASRPVTRGDSSCGITVAIDNDLSRACRANCSSPLREPQLLEELGISSRDMGCIRRRAVETIYELLHQRGCSGLGFRRQRSTHVRLEQEHGRVDFISGSYRTLVIGINCQSTPILPHLVHRRPRASVRVFQPPKSRVSYCICSFISRAICKSFAFWKLNNHPLHNCLFWFSDDWLILDLPREAL
jgi:hypothetical protein